MATRKITESEIQSALRANLFSVSERLEVLEECFIKQGFAYSDTVTKNTDRSRTFSQFGEDTWIKVNVPLPEKGFFIEVGVADGISNSNTYWLEKRGWKGLCFEPDPRNLEIAKLYREDVLPYAVASTNGVMDFNIAAISPDLSGLQNGLPGNKTIRVKTVTLNSILEERSIETVDLLSIDVEGTELDVLKGFDINKYNPKVIILEFLSPAKDIEKELIEYMKEYEYTIAHETYSNLIFVHK